MQIVEFIAVLLKTGNEVAEKELVSSGTIQRILNLFFEYVCLFSLLPQVFTGSLYFMVLVVNDS